MRTEKESSPQISGDMVSLHNMVSPQTRDTRGAPPPSPSLRHLCCTTGTYINTVPLVSTRLSKTKLCFAESRDSRGKLQRLPSPALLQATVKLFLLLKVQKNCENLNRVQPLEFFYGLLLYSCYSILCDVLLYSFQFLRM